MTQFLGLAASSGLTSSSAEGAGGLFARSTVNGQGVERGTLPNAEGGEGTNFAQFLDGENTPQISRQANTATSVSQIVLQGSNANSTNSVPSSFTDSSSVERATGENVTVVTFENEDSFSQSPISGLAIESSLDTVDNINEEAAGENNRTVITPLENEANVSETVEGQAEVLRQSGITVISLPDPSGEIFQRLQDQGVPVQQQDNAVLLPVELNSVGVSESGNDVLIHNLDDIRPVLSFPPEFEASFSNVLNDISELPSYQEATDLLNNIADNTLLLSSDTLSQEDLSSFNTFGYEEALSGEDTSIVDYFAFTRSIGEPIADEERIAFFDAFSEELGIPEFVDISQRYFDDPRQNRPLINQDQNPDLSSTPSPAGESETNGTAGVLPDPLLTVPASRAEELLKGEEVTVNTSQQELGDDLSETLSRNDEKVDENSFETESLVVLPLVGAVNVSQRAGFEPLLEAPSPVENIDNLQAVIGDLTQETSNNFTPQPEEQVDLNVDDGAVNENLEEVALSQEAPISVRSTEIDDVTGRILETVPRPEQSQASNFNNGNTQNTVFQTNTAINVPDPENGLAGNNATTTLEASTTPQNVISLESNESENRNETTRENRPVEQIRLTPENTTTARPVTEGLGEGQRTNLENLAAASFRPAPTRTGEATQPVNGFANAGTPPTNTNNVAIPTQNQTSDQSGNNVANQQFTNNNELTNRPTVSSGEISNNTNQQTAQSLAQGDSFSGARQIAQIFAQPADSGTPLSQITLPQGTQPAQQPLNLTSFQPQAQFSSSPLPNETLPSLSAQISRNVSGGQNGFTIQLNPSELGRVDVRLVSGDDGTLTARIQVEQAETLDLFQRDVRGLERALQQSGLRLSEAGIDLSLRDNGSQNNNQGQQNASNDARGNDNSQNGRDGRQNGNENNPTLSDRLLVEDIAAEVPDSLVRTLYAGISSGQLNIEV